MRVNEGVVVRHVEDIGFLWARRRAVLQNGQLTHPERVQLDGRLDAHIEGALLAGEAARRVALDRLEGRPEAGAVFAASVLTLTYPDARPFERVIAAAVPDESGTAALVSSIGWNAIADVERLLTRWAGGSDPTLLRLAIAGLSSHRRSPGPVLARCVRGPDAGLRAVGAKVARDLGGVEHAEALAALLVDGAPGVRFQAARALARFGDARTTLRDVLLSTSEAGGPFAEEAAAALVRLDPPGARSLFERWAGKASTRRLGLVVAATLGRADLVAVLIPWVNEDGIARSVGEALRAITGADMTVADLARARPASVPGDPSDDPEDPSVELPVDYVLPFPSATKLDAWWKDNRGRFAAEVRYLDGRPIGRSDGRFDASHFDGLRSIARTGRARLQTMAAQALGQALPRLPLIETHALASGVHRLPGWEAYAAREWPGAMNCGQ